MGIKIKAFALALTTGLLSACGGGGGGDGDASSTPVAVSRSGGVFKGLTQNAKVELYAVQNGQVESQPFSTSYTNSEGVYTFSSTSFPEMAFVKISGRDDGVSLMQCDLSFCGTATENSVDTDSNGRIEFGEWLHISADFELTGYFSDWTTNTQPTVSLLTHIVAEKMTSLTEAQLSQAYTEVQNALALSADPRNIDVIDVTSNSVDANILDNIKVAALLENVINNSEQVGLIAQIAALVNDADDSLLPTSSNFSSYDLNVHTKSLLEQLPNADESLIDQLVSTVAEDIDTAATDENKLPESLRPPALPPTL